MGVQLGDFILEKRIGIGGMGQVFLGRQVSLDRLVAVKVMPKSTSNTEEAIRRFEREAKAAANLVHPNVIQIYHFGVERDVPYFAMEYVEGKDLDQRLTDEDYIIGIDEAVDIAIGVTKALDCASIHSIVHRDIKPSNIMITTDGTVKVMDFGLAKAGEVTDQMITQDGMIIGTPHYMSPEQGQGAKLDSRSDIYSLGVVMYQLLTGELPFKADTPTAMIYQHAYEDPRPLREINPDIPEVLERIVLKTMRKKPEDRYQTPAALLEDIENFKRGVITSETFDREESDEIHVAVTQPLEMVEIKKKAGATPIIIAAAAGGGVFLLVVVLLLAGVFTPGNSTGTAVASGTSTTDTTSGTSTAPGTGGTGVDAQPGKSAILPLRSLEPLLPPGTKVLMREPDRVVKSIIDVFKDVRKPHGRYEFTFTRPGYRDIVQVVRLDKTGIFPAFETIGLNFAPGSELLDPYALAEEHFTAERFADALGKYREVEKLDPDYCDVKERIAACEKKVSRLEEREARYKGILDTAQTLYDNQKYDLVEGNLMDIPSDSRYASKARELKAKAAEKLGIVNRHLNDARRLLKTGQYEEMAAKLDLVEGVMKDRRDVLKLREKLKKASRLANVGFAAFNGKDYITARDRLKEVLDTSPDFTEAESKYREADRCVREEEARQGKITKLLIDADKAFANGSYLAAIAGYSEILEKHDKDHVKAKEKRARAVKLKNNREITKVIASLDVSLRASSKDGSAIFEHFTPTASGLDEMKNDFRDFLAEDLEVRKAGHKDIRITRTSDKAGTAEVLAVWEYEYYMPSAGETISGEIARTISFVRKDGKWLISEISDRD